ncbi:MAG: UvrD-helicase domain-containing protein, partial [Acidobacteria bacterium]|nr:UvrD-helicase domain-containing protein [Acidobacteriota bacterium]
MSGTPADGLALDPLAVPLAGSRLIEASAGTGKTWTIAALFLRLVLGHGGARPLAPGEILVMTFTIAATRELAGRIRERLAEAAACFGGAAAPRADDAFLPRLMAAYPAGAAREAAAWRLARAADAMDDAAVTTIDAWCQRMLREHAFTSGSLFDETLMPDETALLAEAARDVWRREVYPLGDAAFALVRARWKDAAALAADVTPLAWRTLPRDAGAAPLAEVVRTLIAQRAAALAALKAGWAARAARLGEWFERQWARRDSPLDKRRLGPAHVRRWLGALAAWADDPAADHLDLGAGQQRLTSAGMRDGIKPGHALELPEEVAAFEALMRALDEQPSPGATLRLHAAARVAARMQELKRARGTFGFADLLARLDDALDAARHGDKARRLRDTILAQFPAALIDEFQDTSPVQLSVFDRVYGIAENDPSRLLLLIGDPKQAIYAFRGADIYSYLRARRATAGRHHALATNRRSTATLVHAVNTLFERAEARPGDGAFGFGGPTAPSSGGDRLPFVRVEAHGRGERLVTSEGPLPAMTLALDAGPPAGNGEIRERFAALAAERIAALLADRGATFEPHADGQAAAVAGDAQLALPFEGEAEPLRPLPPPAPPTLLQPRDIAVLVRTGVEAGAVRHALMRRGIASVYLSDSESVFSSAEAADLLRLLEAVAEPRRAALVRAALATSLVDAPLAELACLADDDAAFEAAAERFLRLHAVWREQGVLAMLRRALHEFDLPARWLAQPGGERRITNVLHLAELLQGAAAEARGEQALVRWLAGELAAPRGGTQPDEQIVRLESDADLVRVVTVHKAKGLEYPVVLLPFPVLFREGGRGAADGVLMPDAGGGAAQWVARPDAQQREWLDRERLREDLRLLYVALTRARHALWVGLAPLKAGRSGEAGDCAWHRSAI